MAVTIQDGWLSGSLPDDTGREWPVRQFRQPSSRGPLAAAIPQLILHTTETSGYVESLKFPSQWQCGEGIIGQHIKLGLAGDAVNDWDHYAQQIEMVGRSQLALWLPPEQTLGPTVALTAWLHSESLIKSGLRRPADWPHVLDQLPAAVPTYYRRLADVWPNTPGVYGHVDIPDNSHWDPGSFNYPAFFARVRKVLGEDDDVALDDYIDGQNRAQVKAVKSDGSVVDPGPVPDSLSPHAKAGWNDVRWQINRLNGRQGPKGDKGDKGDPGDAAKLAVGTTLKVEGT